MSVRVPTSEAGASDLLPLLFPLRRYRNGCAYLFVSVEFFPANLCSGGHPHPSSREVCIRWTATPAPVGRSSSPLTPGRGPRGRVSTVPRSATLGERRER